jgi:hypothetical protein
MECDNATARAGQIGSVEQLQTAVSEFSPAHGITHLDQLLSAQWGKHQLSD